MGSRGRGNFCGGWVFPRILTSRVAGKRMTREDSYWEIQKIIFSKFYYWESISIGAKL
jgi:hypothetical protein